MKFFTVTKDGGEESTVWAYWLIEIKWLFSIALLVFEGKSRDAYHSHAFNCISWLLWGELIEHLPGVPGTTNQYLPSLWPIVTRKETCHKVDSEGRSYALTFRGPWDKEWLEYRNSDNSLVLMGWGRKELRRWDMGYLKEKTDGKDRRTAE